MNWWRPKLTCVRKIFVESCSSQFFYLIYLGKNFFPSFKEKLWWLCLQSEYFHKITLLQTKLFLRVLFVLYA